MTTTIGIYDSATMILLSEYVEHYSARSMAIAEKHALSSAKRHLEIEQRFYLAEKYSLSGADVNSLIESYGLNLLKKYAFKTLRQTL